MIQLQPWIPIPNPKSTTKPKKKRDRMRLARYYQVTNEGLIYLKRMKALENLGLGTSQISELKHLEGLTKMKTLNLKNTQITDEQLVYLKEMTQLQDLLLGGTQVTDAGLVHLREIKSLRNVWLDGCEVTALGIAALESALPDCHVGWSDK